MKKLFFLFLCSVLLLSSVSCGKNFGNAKMQLEKAELTKEEQETASLMEGNTQFFDYRLDDSVHSVSIRLLKLKDGAWQDNGGMDGDASGEGRLAVSYEWHGESVTLSTQNEDGTNSCTMQLHDEENPSTSTCRGTTWEGGPVEIIPEQEIPIGIICENSDRDMTMYGVNSFNEPEKFAEHDAAYAVTVVFSKEKLQ